MTDNLPVEVELEEAPNYRIGRWSDDDRKHVAGLYFIYGTMREVAKHVEIPERTLYTWLKAAWWPAYFDEVRREHADVLEASLSGVVEMALAKLKDRIQYGDEVIDAKGGKHRVEVKAKDLNTIISDSIEKIRTLQNKPSRYTAEAKFNIKTVEREFVELARKTRGTIVSEQ